MVGKTTHRRARANQTRRVAGDGFDMGGERDRLGVVQQAGVRLSVHEGAVSVTRGIIYLGCSY